MPCGAAPPPHAQQDQVLGGVPFVGCVCPLVAELCLPSAPPAALACIPAVASWELHPPHPPTPTPVEGPLKWWWVS